MRDEQEEWDGRDRRDKQKWTLRREISAGDLLAFAAAFIAVVSAYSTLDKRLTILENAGIIQKDIDTRKEESQKDLDRRQDEEALRAQVRVEEALRTLGGKIDRMIEGQRRAP